MQIRLEPPLVPIDIDEKYAVWIVAKEDSETPESQAEIRRLIEVIQKALSEDADRE